MTELIRQRTRHDCAICTIAMALDRTYEEVMEAALATDSFNPTGGCHAEYRIIEKFGLYQLKDFRTMPKGILDPNYFRHLSWGRRAILAVPSLNKPGGFHSVYWDGGTLYDPCDLLTYSEWDALKPIEIILFNEVRT